MSLSAAAQGRWKSILPLLGLPANLLNGRHGPCPLCGEGRDRFRFDDKEGRGTWICSVCGAGDGIEFVKLKHGVDFKAAAAMIEPLIGVAPAMPVRQGPSENDFRRWRNDLWLGARPVQPDDPVGLYLRTRVGVTRFPRCLRYHPNVEHRDEGGRKTWHPAMLAIVAGPDGRPANLHRTYLRADGRKAEVDPARRMMPGDIPSGAAIQLFPAAEEMGVAEGIETAYAAASRFGIPVWSTISDRILAKWTPPAGVKRVFIFGDNDPGFAGQAAAFALARSIAGRRLAEATVRIPETIGEDWDDVVRTELLGAVA